MSYGKTPNSPGLGGKIVDPTGSSFNNMPFVDNGAGEVGLDKAREKYAPKADKPTIAAVDPKTDLPTALQQTGTDAQTLPQMMQLLNSVRSMMNMNNSGGNNNQSSNDNTNTNNLSGINQAISTALTDTYSEIADNTSFDNVINVLIKTFSNSQVSLNPNYQSTVSQSILQLILNVASSSNTSNLEYYTIPPANVLANVSISNTNFSNSSYISSFTQINVVVPSSTMVTPTPVVNTAPDHYTQEYFSISNDPTPGYVAWLSSDGSNSLVYTIRTQNQPNYESTENALLGQTEIYLYDALYNYFYTNTLTISILNDILDDLFPLTQTAADDSTLGQNSSSNIMSMALQILGSIGSVINMSNDEHIPNSVLNQSSMSNTIQMFTKNIGVLQQMKNKSSGAFNPSSILDSLGGIGGNQGSIDLSQLTSSIGTGSSSSSPNQISQQSYDNLSAISNNVTSNTLSTISSVTLKLQKDNIPQNTINNIQILLSEILE